VSFEEVEESCEWAFEEEVMVNRSVRGGEKGELLKVIPG
jgi:hypothetical protein